MARYIRDNCGQIFYDNGMGSVVQCGLGQDQCGNIYADRGIGRWECLGNGENDPGLGSWWSSVKSAASNAGNAVIGASINASQRISTFTRSKCVGSGSKDDAIRICGDIGNIKFYKFGLGGCWGCK